MIERWVRESFPCILKAVTARRAHLVFVDEAGFMLEPIVRSTYAPEEKPLCIALATRMAGFRRLAR